MLITTSSTPTRVQYPPMGGTDPDARDLAAKKAMMKASEVHFAQQYMQPVQIGSKSYDFDTANKLVNSLAPKEKADFKKAMGSHHVFSYYKVIDKQGHQTLKVAFTPTPAAKHVLERHIQAKAQELAPTV